MSDGTPPRACLADFGSMTMILDPKQPLSCSAQLEGRPIAFVAPELLVPDRFGLTESVPTQKSDIYAFGLVIYQVRNQNRGTRRLLTSFRSSRVRPRSTAFAWGK